MKTHACPPTLATPYSVAPCDFPGTFLAASVTYVLTADCLIFVSSLFDISAFINMPSYFVLTNENQIRSKDIHFGRSSFHMLIDVPLLTPVPAGIPACSVILFCATFA